MNRLRCTLALLAFSAFYGSGPLFAEHPLPGPHFLDCVAEGDTVHLSWDVLGIDPLVGFQAFLERDGDIIAQLAPGDLSYDDTGVPSGPHVYRLVVVSPDGLVDAVECKVEVGGFVACDVEGNVVTVRWQVPDNILALGFVISRDNEIVATLGPDARSYREEAPPGEHVYTVVTDNALGSPGAPPDFLIGSCSVVVEGGGIQCDVDGNVVTIRWQTLPPDIPVFLPIFGFVVSRDGQRVATLGPDVTSYSEEAPPGEHVYTVVALTAGTDPNVPGEPILVGTCSVVVEGGIGIQCDVEGNVVTIHWQPLPINVPIVGFVVSRDGQRVATLGPDVTSYSEEAPPGEHVYTVVALTAGTDPNVPGETILVGTCRVVVEGGFGIQCDVDGNVVTIRWQPLPIDIAIFGFAVSRDGQRVATLGPDATSYSEEAPPGEHVYTVVAMTTGPDGNVAGDGILVGSCRVVVEDGLPAPRDLQCSIAESFPIQVQLFWTNPVVYGAIVVTRNNERIAVLDGDATRFSEFDPGPGRYVYGVAGMRNGLQSAPATCVVEIEGPPLRNRLSLASVNGVPAGDPNNNEGSPGSDTVAVILENKDPVQAWSFGVCSDPSVLSVGSADIEGTDTAGLNDGQGPTFLVVNVFEGGVTMAAVIDERDPADVLPPEGAYSLLEIRYEAGPDAVRGERYEVDFCQELGEPPVAVVVVVRGFDVRPQTSPGTVVFTGFRFLRGDATNDSEVNITDAVFVLDWLFRGGRPPMCLEATDTNSTREVNIGDPVYLLQNLFVGGPPPEFPFPQCGSAPVTLSCETSVCND